MDNDGNNDSKARLLNVGGGMVAVVTNDGVGGGDSLSTCAAATDGFSVYGKGRGGGPLGRGREDDNDNSFS